MASRPPPPIVKVLVVSHLYPRPSRAASLFVHDQVVALGKLGVVAEVVSPTPWTPHALRVSDRLRARGATPPAAVIDGVPVTYPRVLIPPRRLLVQRQGELFYRGLRPLLPALRRARPDLVHAHQAFPDGAAARLLAQDLAVPYVVTVHDLSSILFMQETGARGSLRLFRTRRGLSRANKVIVVSAATRREVENLVEIPPERIRQVHGAPDPIFLERSRNPEVHALEKQRTLERYQINYPFLLYAGAIRPQKNIPRLVEAFAVLRGDLERHPAYKDLRLLIIGDEISRHPAVRRTVIQTRMEDFVRFLGFVPTDTLRIIYETAAAFVFPSLYEGFGLPPLEAMACGTPVVTSNTSSLPEVVGAAAVLVKPENVFDIARGMREVLLDNELRARLVEKGYEQVKRFSWERTAREVLEVYGEVGRGK